VRNPSVVEDRTDRLETESLVKADYGCLGIQKRILAPICRKGIEYLLEQTPADTLPAIAFPHGHPADLARRQDTNGADRPTGPGLGEPVARSRIEPVPFLGLRDTLLLNEDIAPD
jgi:hypothetical protein